jgi:pilus assembly protein CpaB
MNRVIKIVSIARPVKPQVAAQTHQGVVTTRAIAAGDFVTADAVKLDAVPDTTQGGVQNLSDAVGRVAMTPLAAGTPLLDAQLNAGLSAHVQPGERAVAIRVDEQTGVGNRVRPGDFVDVFVLLRRDGTEVDQSEARLLLPRLRVLGFGSASVGNTEVVNAAQGSNAKPQEIIRTAVLAVPVDQVAALSLGDNAGKLTLALRNPADAGASNEPAILNASMTASKTDAIGTAQTGVVLADLQSKSATRGVPAKAVAATTKVVHAARPSVDVIRAGKVETVAY